MFLEPQTQEGHMSLGDSFRKELREQLQKQAFQTPRKGFEEASSESLRKEILEKMAKEQSIDTPPKPK